MKVLSPTNNQQLSFNGSIFVNLSALENSKVLPVIAEFKKELRPGLSYKSFKADSEVYLQDVFVGYNKGINPETAEESYGILIATGCNNNYGNLLFTKLANVDTPILKTINKVLEKFHLVNNPSVGVVKTSPYDDSGHIRKISRDGLKITVSPKFINDLDDDFVQRTGYYYHDKSNTINENVVYLYSKDTEGQYEHVFTGVMGVL